MSEKGTIMNEDTERHKLLAEPEKTHTNKKNTKWIVILGTLTILAASFFVVALLFGFNVLTMESATAVPTSSYGLYRYAAVASENDECSTVGVELMARQGATAVDAAIATLLCLGVQQSFDMGIGGGGAFTIFATPRNGRNKTLITINAREVAPLAADSRMFVNDSVASSVGGLAIAVPGEVKGYYEAWSRFGGLPWAKLFEPAIAMAKNGFRAHKSLSNFIRSTGVAIRKTPSLRDVFVKEDGSFYTDGDILKMPVLGRTLEILAAEGYEAFYNGSLSNDIVQDIQDSGGIITAEDLRNYKVRIRAPIRSVLRSKNWTVHSVAPPFSGSVLQFILNIMDGYNLSRNSIDKDHAVLTYHRMVEAFKFAYAKRSMLGDEEFVDVSDVVFNLTSNKYADYIRSKINDTNTQNISYYGPAFYSKERKGTSHVSVLAPDGSAVAVTSTINTEFGAQRRGKRTGILFNNQMDDFSTHGSNNWYGLAPSPANKIEPGKRPVSSMCPTIILDEKQNVVHVTGGTGGSQITSAVAFVTIHNIMMGKPIHEAVDIPRLHHQLVPNNVNYEEQVSKNILDGLITKGHKVTPALLKDSTVEAIVKNFVPDDPRCKVKCIEAVSDRRIFGKPDGY